MVTKREIIDMLCIVVDPLQTLRTDTADRPRRFRSERTLCKSCDQKEIQREKKKTLL